MREKYGEVGTEGERKRKRGRRRKRETNEIVADTKLGFIIGRNKERKKRKRKGKMMKIHSIAFIPFNSLFT